MIGPATGIKRAFYRPFAEYLADNGFGVITFDNSGIGDSLVGSVSASDASLVTWGQLDMPAVLRALQEKFPNTSYHLIGHSAGGQLVGLMPNAMQLTSIFNVACSSGSLRNLKGSFRWKGRFFMKVFIPVSNRIWGHTKSQWMDMGEPLPKRVAQQWAEWCSGSGYVKVLLDKQPVQHLYNDLNCPAFWLNTVDDDIANNDNMQDMIRVFTSMKAQTRTLDPKDFGMDGIGHMKFFSRQKKVLWELTLEWLHKNS